MEHTLSAMFDEGEIWALSDGRPGNARQAEALADALLPGRVNAIHLVPRVPWRWASPHRLPGSRFAFGAEFAAALNRPPGLAIGCGRQAALATRLLRAAGSQIVQILAPRMACKHWDTLIIPAHDGVDGENVIPINGSLNPVDDVWLVAARAEFSWLARFPAPRLGILVGGDSRHGKLSAATGEMLANSINHWYRTTGGSILATTSRRTPVELSEHLRQQMRRIPGLCWTGPGDGANPYPGLLAFSERIVCSADSVNLLSEACATRVPVLAVGVDNITDRRAEFIRSLLSSGRMRTLESVDDLTMPVSSIQPLRETARIAAIMRERIKAIGLLA